MSEAGVLRRAWALVRSESRAETYVAVVLLLVAFGPAVVRLWKLRKQMSGGGR
jgi:hypothetical protein